jgi:hypothetical protein
MVLVTILPILRRNSVKTVDFNVLTFPFLLVLSFGSKF